MIIKVLLKVLKETKPRTKNQAIAKGLYKLPETWPGAQGKNTLKLPKSSVVTVPTVFGTGELSFSP